MSPTPGKWYVNNNLNKRFSSDSLVYSSIDDIPKSGSCFGTISKSIKIGDVTIPAYSRFSFMNTGNSSDGALFAIDSNGYSYTAYRTSGVWNKCFATATKSDFRCGESIISANTGAANVTFPQAFDDIPVVIATVKGVSKYVMLIVKVDNISKNGFTVTAVTLENGSEASPSYAVTVEWIAMRKS